MGFYKYTIRRFLQSIPVLFGLSILVFGISRIMPGKPARLALGPKATPQQVQDLRQSMGLNQPLPDQYLDWLAGFVTGDWGASLITENNVYDDIVRVFPATVELTLVALFLAIVFGVALGVLSSLKKDELGDHASRVLALGGVSLPRFMMAILLQLVIGYWFNLLPLSGRIGDVSMPTHYTGLLLLDSLLSLNFAAFQSALAHIILPAIALSLASLANIMRLTRSNMIEIRSEEYVSTMRANGLPNNLLVYKYMVKNAFSITLTIIGLELGSLLAGSFVIEVIFSWPGMGLYGLNAILRKDLNAIVGVIMVVGVGYLLANLLVDLLYGYLDPRISYGGTGT